MTSACRLHKFRSWRSFAGPSCAPSRAPDRSGGASESRSAAQPPGKAISARKAAGVKTVARSRRSRKQLDRSHCRSEHTPDPRNKDQVGSTRYGKREPRRAPRRSRRDAGCTAITRREHTHGDPGNSPRQESARGVDTASARARRWRRYSSEDPSARVRSRSRPRARRQPREPRPRRRPYARR